MMASATLPGEDDGARSTVSFGEALRFWLRLGFISFGGPAGQIALMHKELVEERRWIGEQRFLEGLQAELRSGAYRPSPARRKLIPKAGKPGQFRPLSRLRELDQRISTVILSSH